MTKADGATYDGDWIKGKKEGFGTKRLADGRAYVGEWKNGKQHGILNSILKLQEWEGCIL